MKNIAEGKYGQNKTSRNKDIKTKKAWNIFPAT